MEERYIRNIGPLSRGDCECLRGKSVFVAGCGGLGGFSIDMLLRVGVGHIAVADGDVFEPSNLNRQLLCRTELMGESKAKASAKYAQSVNPEVSFTAHDTFITEENVCALISGCDAVLDALDNVQSRRLLKAECDRQSIPYIYGAISGWIAQSGISMPNDGLLDKLYPEELPVKDEGSLAFTAAACASLQCALCVQLLCSKEPELGRLYLLDLSEFDFAKL